MPIIGLTKPKATPKPLKHSKKPTTSKITQPEASQSRTKTPTDKHVSSNPKVQSKSSPRSAVRTKKSSQQTRKPISKPTNVSKKKYSRSLSNKSTPSPEVSARRRQSHRLSEEDSDTSGSDTASDESSFRPTIRSRKPSHQSRRGSTHSSHRKRRNRSVSLSLCDSDPTVSRLLFVCSHVGFLGPRKQLVLPRTD